MHASPEIVNIAFAALVAFFIGAIPAAYVAARLHGINIFDVGSRQAGATNVWKNVSRKTGFVVFIIDVAKGIITVLVSRYIFEVSGLLFLVPAIGVIFGHWFSPMTKFKGGDGVASLGGLVVGLFEWAALPAAIVAIAFGVPPLRFKFAHPSLQAGVTGWGVLLLTVAIASPSAERTEHLVLFVGISLLALAVLLKSVRFHKQNSQLFGRDKKVDPGEIEDRRPAESEN